MINAAGLIRDVARYLTDYDETQPKFQHVEWTKLDLLHYLRIAVSMAAAATPKRFAKQITVALTGESPVRLPPDCDMYLETVASVDESGVRTTDVREMPRDSTIYTIRRDACADGESPKVSSVRQSSSNDNAIEVTPGNAKGKLIVDCFCAPSVDSDTAMINMPTSFEPVLFWWMVSMAFGTDIEAVPMRERSDAYWARGAAALMALMPTAKPPPNPSARVAP